MRSFVLGLVATLALLAVPTPALAHASVESSDPADGATLSALPQTVSVTLNEEIGSGAVLRVIDSSGTRLDDGEVTVAGRRVLVGVRTADAEPGAYRLVYRVVSADGHAVSGQVGFTVSAGASASEPSASAGNSQDDVTITEVEDEPTQKWAPLWVLGFLVISSALIVYIVKAGLTSADGEDEA
ncbi:copper resistance CopC family protein [Aeromicrobium sp. Leaf272]|uniref:copper resistance CopC family protein n=1 Tax=Aeromicrobium sp. Leaf272 TaxID=1736317 RepID=UPI0006F9AE8D|nr:copper resistance CopC family protein [Aeromicrobium sp. Leaf272]KQP28031.1 hypothetical protein ASF38_04470 [Aeromicrobium sp. Leaf272]